MRPRLQVLDDALVGRIVDEALSVLKDKAELGVSWAGTKALTSPPSCAISFTIRELRKV